MTIQDAAARVLDRIGSGGDVRLVGAPAPLFLTEVADRLEAFCSVVRVTAPAGGLSLSAFIAQLSGLKNFDEHDDAALELGFRRLAEPEAPHRRTVLLLDAAEGVQRPVLRYLQQAGRAAVNLVLLVAFCPDLDALLSEPGMAPLRTRLTDATITLSGVEPTVAPPLLPVLEDSAPVSRAPVVVHALPSPPAPVAVPAEWTAGAPAAPISLGARRRTMGWIASGMGVAASLALGVWLGRSGEHGTSLPLTYAGEVASPTVASSEVQRQAVLTVPVVDAIRPAVIPATVPLPYVRPTPKPPEAQAAPVALAPQVAVALAPQAPAGPSPAVMASVETQAAATPPVAAEPRPTQVVRAHWQAVARARPRMESPRAEEGDRAVFAGGGFAPEADGPTGLSTRRRFARLREPGTVLDDFSQRDTYGAVGRAGWLVSRSVPRASGQYIGTFTTGPGGARVFRYGP